MACFADDDSTASEILLRGIPINVESAFDIVATFSAHQTPRRNTMRATTPSIRIITGSISQKPGYMHDNSGIPASAKTAVGNVVRVQTAANIAKVLYIDMFLLRPMVRSLYHITSFYASKHIFVLKHEKGY